MPLSVSDVHPVILAGGLGTRLRGVVADRPKPLASADGRPFLEWVVRYLGASDFRAATISAGYLGTMIEQHFREQPVPGIRVECVHEETPLGTAGGFLYAARRSGQSPKAWLVLNGDSLIFADLDALLHALALPGTEAAIVARRVEDAARYGTLTFDREHRLIAFAEKTAEPPAGALINAGVYLLRDSVLNRFPGRERLSFEYDLFPALLEASVGIQVVESDVPFLDIGTEATLAQADAFIRTNRGRFP